MQWWKFCKNDNIFVSVKELKQNDFHLVEHSACRGHNATWCNIHVAMGNDVSPICTSVLTLTLPLYQPWCLMYLIHSWWNHRPTLPWNLNQVDNSFNFHSSFGTDFHLIFLLFASWSILEYHSFAGHIDSFSLSIIGTVIILPWTLILLVQL